jgi:hypothetical protein
MPFAGGGGGDLPNHQHSNVPLSGGPLDMANVTVGSLGVGSVVYSDGNALQELVAPGVPGGETLTFAPAATAPSWGSASGGAMELISTVEVSSDSTPLNHTWSSVSFDDYSMVSVFFNGRLQNVTDLDMTLQNPALTGSVYASERWYVASGSATAGQQTTDKIRLPVNSSSYRGRIDITAGDSTNTGDRCLHWFIQCNTAGGTQAMILQSGYYTACNVTPVTDSTGIHYNANSGNIKAGFFSSAYKFART